MVRAFDDVVLDRDRFLRFKLFDQLLNRDWRHKIVIVGLNDNAG